jgi:hypothetical protein
MTTYGPSDVKLQRGDSTDFVLHKSQQVQFHGIQKKIIDYTEYRLIRFANACQDQQQKLVLMALIVDYRKGNVAIAWRRGTPTYIRVTKSR